MVTEVVSATPMSKAAVAVVDPKGLIGGCEPSAVMRFRLLVLGLALLGYGRVRVIAGRRTLDSEGRLYGLGRTERECGAAGVPGQYSRPGEKRVVWCKPSESNHVRGLAIDVSFAAYGEVSVSHIGELVADLGIHWGRDWKVRDREHFEV
jgi:hypothetical protein